MKDEVGRTCRMHVGVERCSHGFGWEAQSEEITGRM